MEDDLTKIKKIKKKYNGRRPQKIQKMKDDHKYN